ncbi:MAG: hypothetical protein ACWA45_05785 [Flavobacteriales bacterium]
MKLKIQENAIDFEELKKVLKNEFGMKYQVKKRQKGIIAVAKNKTCAALVVPTKNKLIINGGFPTMVGQIIFTLLMIGLGILIPLIIYFIFFHKKMKEVEKEVSSFLKEKYKDVIIS